MKKIGFLILFVMSAFVALSQNTFYQPLTAGPSGPKINLDTVTNTATNYLTSYAQGKQAVSTTVWVTVTKISGTVAGTITLQGSLDGTNFKAANTSDSQTALATVTATDATNTYHWRLAGNPYNYYRISWTGAGTMAASFSGRIMVK
jgi:hypothetical protein